MAAPIEAVRVGNANQLANTAASTQAGRYVAELVQVGVDVEGGSPRVIGQVSARSFGCASLEARDKGTVECQHAVEKIGSLPRSEQALHMRRGEPVAKDFSDRCHHIAVVTVAQAVVELRNAY